MALNSLQTTLFSSLSRTPNLHPPNFSPLLYPSGDFWAMGGRRYQKTILFIFAELRLATNYNQDKHARQTTWPYIKSKQTSTTHVTTHGLVYTKEKRTLLSRWAWDQCLVNCKVCTTSGYLLALHRYLLIILTSQLSFFPHFLSLLVGEVIGIRKVTLSNPLIYWGLFWMAIHI